MNRGHLAAHQLDRQGAHHEGAEETGGKSEGMRPAADEMLLVTAEIFEQGFSMETLCVNRY